MAKQIGTGLLLALQFFSVFPIRKNLPMERSYLTAMYGHLPVLGFMFGGILAIVTLLLRETTDMSSGLAAFIVVLGSLIMTGGLHMDGLADVGDAYFSYRGREKRLEIMGDPRIGAFGAMTLILAIAGKTLVVAETIFSVPLWMIVFIPVIARIGLMLLFSLTQSAKSSGLAAYFQKSADTNIIAVLAFVWLFVAAAIMIFLLGWQVAFALLLSFLAASILYRRWCLKHFGGVTGDLFGAYVEGLELLLWIILLFFI